MAGKHILLMAYQLSPHRGSEYSVSWNYLVEMSKDNRITVLYGVTGGHLGCIEPVKDFQVALNSANVEFIPVHPNALARALNTLNRKGVLRFTFYLAYNIWQRQAYLEAKKLVRSRKFDIIHFLGPIGYREPGYLWKLPLPYVWGPISGMANPPSLLLRRLPAAGRMDLQFRKAVNRIQLRTSLRLRKAMKRADAVLAATQENQRIIEKIFGIKAGYLPENGVASPIAACLPPGRFPFSTMNLLWVGSLDARKNLGLLLDALAEVKSFEKMRLHVAGDGWMRQRLEAQAGSLGISSHIEWHGLLPRAEVLRLYEQAHISIITSCKEGNPTIIWEAMASGVPTITLDHCGMHDTICGKCGVRIPIKSYEQIVSDLSDSIESLFSDPRRLRSLSEGALSCASRYAYANRHAFFNHLYDKAIEHYGRIHDVQFRRQ